MAQLDVLSRLPKREFYFTKEVALAFSVTDFAIQYHAKRRGIGRKMKRSGGGRGYYIFSQEDIGLLSAVIRKKRVS